MPKKSDDPSSGSDSNAANVPEWLTQAVDGSGSASGKSKRLPIAAGTILLGRYTVLDEVGEGGMGFVLRVHDRHLGRELAIKVMKAAAAESPNAVQRFIDEARVCGNLQHPGIVPVHEIGTLLDGRPFFAMKLVQGRTLDELLHGVSSSKDLPRLTNIFHRICQAVGYAHSRDVIHRDLKPLNVMVGEFGEVQLMDWGLAKGLSGVDFQVAETDRAGSLRSQQSRRSTFVEQPAPTGGSSSSHNTEAGQVLGTLAYMSPEQAIGDLARVDRRSDVFALGSILCEILTGEPAYTGERGVMLVKSRSGNLMDAVSRLDRCGADRELVEIARTCLRSSPEDRPADGGAVAALVERYLADVDQRLREAIEQRAAAQARAEEEQRTRQVAEAKTAVERRARRLTLGLAAAVLLLIAGIGGSFWYAQQQRADARARQLQREHAVREAVTEARLLLEQARAQGVGDLVKFRDAVAAANRAADLAFAGAGGESQREANQLRDEASAALDFAGRTRALLAALLEAREPRETKRYEEDEDGQLTAVGELTAEERFAHAFRAWGLDVDATPVADAAARLRALPGPILDELIAGLDDWAAERMSLRGLKASWRLPSELADALDQDDRRRELRRIRTGSELSVERALSELTKVLLPMSQLTGQTVGAHRRRLGDLARQMDPADEPVLGVLALHRALVAAGDDANAEAVLRAAVVARPSEVVFRDALGKLCERKGFARRDEAIRCYEAARAIRPELGISLARVLQTAGRTDEAEAILRDLVRRSGANPEMLSTLAQVLMGRGKNNQAELILQRIVELRPDDATAYGNLGTVQTRLKRYVEAEAAYRRAIELRPDDAPAHSNLALLLLALEREVEAAELLGRFAELKPNDFMAHSILGDRLKAQGRLDLANVSYRRALEINPKFALGYLDLGKTLELQKKGEESERVYRSGIEAVPSYSTNYLNLALGLHARGKFAEAEDVYRKALGYFPYDSTMHHNLGSALYHQKKYVEAIASYEKAISLKSDYSLAHFNLGETLRILAKYSDAETAYRKAIQHNRSYSEALNGLGRSLLGQKRYADAEAAFRRALVLKPNDSAFHMNVGLSLYHQKLFSEAETEYRKAIAINPNFVLARTNLAVLLRDQNKVVEAEAELRRVVELDPKASSGFVSLGNVLREQNKHAAAVEVYRRAIELAADSTACHSLGHTLRDAKYLPEAESAYRKALELNSKLLGSQLALGQVLRDQKKHREAETAYRAAIALKPDDERPHFYHGLTLQDLKRSREAEAAYRKTLELKPNQAEAHYHLGEVLRTLKDFDGAAASFRKAIDLNAKHAAAYRDLGDVLNSQKKYIDAEPMLRRAVELAPDDVITHLSLGETLRNRVKYADAEAAYRKAIELQPNSASGHNGLGIVLRAQKKLSEAEATYRKVLELKPDEPVYYSNYGMVLRDLRRFTEAEAALRKSIALRPTFAGAHLNLADLLRDMNKLSEAEAAYLKAVAIDPDPQRLTRLGNVQLALRKYEEAEAAFGQAIKLSTEKSTMLPSLRELQYIAGVGKRLPDVLAGRDRPSNLNETLAIAELCARFHSRPAMALELYSTAFRQDSKLLDSSRRRPRYNAACAAALVAGGQGDDIPSLAPEEQLAASRLAREWLRTELATQAVFARSSSTLARSEAAFHLQSWKVEASLAAVRDRPLLACLPDQEQNEWLSLWSEVDAVLSKLKPSKD